MFYVGIGLVLGRTWFRVSGTDFLRLDPDPYSYRESDPDPHPVNLNPEPPPCLKEVVSEGFEDLESDLGVLLVESLDLGAQLVILLQQRAQRLSLHSIVGINK